MSIKKKIYNILVAKKQPIRRKYVKYKAEGNPPLKRAVYLFRLNCSYYLFGDKKLSGYGKSSAKPYASGSESSLRFEETPEALAEKLANFDVISFDIFDTLIYRPFAKPTDLFFLAGAKTNLLNFAETREYCERKARELKFSACQSYEIDIDDIYEYMEKYAGAAFCSAKEEELNTELELCFANPYMKKVWRLLREKNKRVVVTSDMYLKKEFLEKLLRKNGFDGFEKLFVSNEEGCSKYDGGLYETVKKYAGGGKIAHIGDNVHSDIKKSREHSLTPFQCHNPNTFGSRFRPDNMSKIIGSAYCGLVNAKLHNGSAKYPMLYEYGYAFSGIFVLGFCQFIKKIKRETSADKILFLARDGDLPKKVYDCLYPEDNTEYFLWSRSAATKLCFEENLLDFCCRFVYYKSDGQKTADEIFKEMELPELSEDFPQKEMIVNDKNCRLIYEYLADNKERAMKLYQPLFEGARKYLKEKIGESKKVLAIDVGWAGSGGAAIALLARKWGLPADIIGVIGCANDSFTEQPDASESFMQTGKLYSYCYSQSHNRDKYLSHDSAAGHNIFFEMLLGSAAPSLKGFDEGGQPVFSKKEKNNDETVELIHSGALDFISDYTNTFKNYPYMLTNISGSDAYAPFQFACETCPEYFRAVLGNCSFNTGVGTEEKSVASQI